ncbi:MAG: HAMP domain-containing protein [Candidatus Omnitrophica bacterium]|nr:HAMP domain-containing protein [Candidatus Omnitrophota bacterium]
MKISRKIGLGLVTTFLLSIFLGALSIYSLRLTYKSLEEVLTRDVPALRLIGEAQIEFTDMINAAFTHAVTGDADAKKQYVSLSEKTEADLNALTTYVGPDVAGKILNVNLNDYDEITDTIERLFVIRSEMRQYIKKSEEIFETLQKRLDLLITAKEKAFGDSKDIFLIQSDYLPAISILTEIKSLLMKYSAYERLLVMTGDEHYIQLLVDLDVSVQGLIDQCVSGFQDDMSEQHKLLSNDFRTVSGIAQRLNKHMSLQNALIDGLLMSLEDFIKGMRDIFSYKRLELSRKAGLTAVLSEHIPAGDAVIAIGVTHNQLLPQLGALFLTDNKKYIDDSRDIAVVAKSLFDEYQKHVVSEAQEERIGELYARHLALDGAFAGVLAEKEAFDQQISGIIATMKEVETILGRQHSIALNASAQQLDTAIFYERCLPVIQSLMDISRLVQRMRFALVHFMATGAKNYYSDYTDLYFMIKAKLGEHRRIVLDPSHTKDMALIEENLDRVNAAILKTGGASPRQLSERFLDFETLCMQWSRLAGQALSEEFESVDRARQEIIAQQRIVNTLTFFIVGAIAAISVLVGIYTARNITRPIQKLMQGARELARGHLDYHLSIKTGDEIEELSEEFNRMAFELKELYSSLEQKVAERTAELAEANRALERSNKELDDFTYVVSHDLKEPLRGIRAFCGFLLEEYSDKIDEQGRAYLQTIADSGKSMARLIEDLLSLSRVSRRKNPYEATDLNEVLDGVKSTLEFAITEKQVLLTVGRLPKVVCDRVRIAEVFTNLISNAVKFMDKPSPAVEVGCTDKEGFFEFFVKDNGIGIPEDAKEKVFQIFQRLHGREKYEGTGAGLTIVKKIVESHGGRIWVESRLGEGSVFYFTLPKSLKESGEVS